MLTSLALIVAALAVITFFVMLHNGAGGLSPAGLRLAADAGVVTLAQAKLGATDDVDTMVIDEFQKQSFLANALQFDDVVNQAGNGGTLTYGYTRLITQPTAGFRAVNAEYTPQEVTKQRFTVDLKPLGGSFQIDRVLDGIAAAAETTLQMQQKIKGATAAFTDAFINGDVAVDANGFDGISKALVGTTTELGAATVTDFSAIAAGNDTAFGALDVVDELLALLDGPAAVLMANGKLMSKLRGIARRAGYWTADQVQFDSGFLRVEQFGNVTVIDPGTKAGSNVDIIPVTAKALNAVGGSSPAGNYTDLYAVRLGLDGVHGVAMAGRPLVQSWMPDFERAGAVKTGEVEMGPVAIAIKATKSLAVRRNIRVS